MSWIRSKANIILLGSSCIIALIIIEIASKYVLKQEDIYHWGNRYALFSDEKSGGVFRNIGKFFVYEPNKKIRSTTYYYLNSNWVKEYDYIIPTNNLGLVQTKVTQPKVPSLLLLGDSFTEGQGAPPWFQKFESNFSQKSIQYVNGGIFGTGFQHWQLIHDFLVAENVEVKHLVVIFISEDYDRGLFQIPKHTIDCLADYKSCVGDENFYGMPLGENHLSFLEELRGYREGLALSLAASLKGYVKHYLPATTMVIRFLKNNFLTSEAKINHKANKKIISNFISHYKNNVIFVHVPTKYEVKTGRINPIGSTVVADINRLSGDLYDGHTKCGLTEADYFVNDGHPNAGGYSKISDCVTTAVKMKWGLH